MPDYKTYARTTNITIRLSEEEKKNLKAIAAERQMPISRLVREFIIRQGN